MLLLASGSIASAESIAERTLPATVASGEEFTVAIALGDFGPLGRVVESIPAGFEYVPEGTPGVFNITADGNEVTFTLMVGATSFTYDVVASEEEGIYDFTGIMDAAIGVDNAIVTSDVSGDTEITVLEGTTSGSNSLPTATIFSISPNPAVESETVTFNGSGTDTDGTIVSYKWTSSVDGQLSISAIFSTSGLSSGNHAIDFSAQDNDGAWSEEVSTTFIVNEVATRSSGGSSSSGGGGSGASGEAFENIAFKDVNAENIIGGLVITYSFDEMQNSIDYIKFSALKNYGEVSTTIEVLKDKSTMVDEVAPGLVYSNLNIWVGNVGFATEDNIAYPVIGFSVSKEWLVENGINEDSIALYRYSDGKWNNLNTIKIGEDVAYLYFEAETPGFSPFAISANVEEDDMLVVKDIDPKYAEDAYESGAEPTDHEPVNDPESLPGISMVLSLIILVSSYIFITRRN
ncbi:PGF-pre-PGF domain-containing protein [Methanococcoides sp. SA1]|nr:PGF-pre-PGF domain-containing protein [Methanococcoides sp. SA1]